MNFFLIKIVLNYSIIVAGILSIARFKTIIVKFYPFIFLIWIGILNETISLLFIYSRHSNTVNSNLFVLLEYWIILWQFYKWNNNHLKRYYWLVIAGLVMWIADNCIIHHITENNSLFRVFYSFVITFFSINQLNKILIFENGPLFKNAMFIICVGFLVYFGTKAFIESFNAFRVGFTNAFLANMWIILYFVNVMANLLYAAAIIWIPRKRKFILPH